MRITPKTDEEINNVWAAGVYPFEILDASETVSKSGNDMIKLKLDFGRGKIMFDYLMDSFPKKIKHACRHLGFESAYKSGHVTSDMFVGKTGYAKLSKKDDPTYGVQNSVEDYLSMQEGQATAVAEALHDDDIPFA